MAQNQAQGGNSMAAMLGNMQNKTQRPGAMYGGNYGGGMQPNLGMQTGVWRGPVAGQPNRGGMQPIPPGGQGYPQMGPQQMQNLAGQLSAMQGQPGQQLQGGAPGNMAGLAGNMAGQMPQAGRMPRRPMGAPGMGAGGGKNQQIAQLPGGPPMGR